VWAVSTNIFLAQALTDPSGSAEVIIGQTAAVIPADNAPETIDANRNGYATVAARAGTISSLYVRVLAVLSGATPLSDNVNFTFQILTAPATFGTNDFTASPVTTTVTVPAGSIGGSYFLLNSDLVDSVALIAGQRFLINMVVTTNPLGNASDLFSALAVNGGILFT
jgi:hypothetical protein